MGDAPVKGLLLHAGGQSERGVRSLDVLASKEDAERFLTERVMLGLGQLGVEGGPPLSFQAFDLPYVARG